jgi:DNA-binding CsgD family transcriptional regulator
VRDAGSEPNVRDDRQAQAVVAAVRAGGNRRVVAPGGMGKTHLLEQIAIALGDDDVTRWSPHIDPDNVPEDGGVLLADDVHLASEESLRLLARRRGGVVAAHRPAAGGAQALLGALDGAPLVLGPLGGDGVAALLAERWQEEPAPEIVAAILAATGGVPRLVMAVAGDRPLARVERTATLDETVRSERQRLDDPAHALLDAAAVLPGLDLSLLAAACELGIDDAAAAAAQLAAAGLAPDADAHVAGVVADAVRGLVPASEIAAIAERAAAAALASGHDVIGVAERIRDSGVTGTATAQCLLLAARKVLDEDSERARAWVDAAANGGAVPGDLAAVQALISFREGNVEDTVAAVDSLLRAGPGSQRDDLRREAVETAAVVLARRGAWMRSAELAEAVGPEGDNAVALAAIARLAVGDAAGVRKVVEAYDTAPPPGLRSAAAAAVARGLVASLSDDPAPALPLLLDAARLYELSAPSVPLPEAPHTLAAVVACHLWEFDVASQILDDSPSRLTPGSGRRQQLLSAWVAMRRGDWVGALASVEQVREDAGTLDARDALLARAVEAGVARRSSKLDDMETAWRAARTLLLRQIPDLLLLQPVGELLITGARLEDRGTVSTCLSSLRQLLSRGDHPPLWALSMLWDELHISIALNDTAGTRAAAKAADALPGMVGRAGTVAAAALCWADALGGDADPERVRVAGRALADVGLTWEAGKLVGATAIRTSDSAEMRSLLQFARSLNAERTPAVTQATDLSPRERDVAGHLLSGLTYREIGAQLYIAPKTVEHHVARIRRKLGATSRAELLLALRRQLLAGQA